MTAERLKRIEKLLEDGEPEFFVDEDLAADLRELLSVFRQFETAIALISDIVKCREEVYGK